MDILLAVSGGIDSMYMLHRASELFPGASFAVAHCNFSLRGEESDGDEAFVRAACERAGLRCFVRRFNTLEHASGNGLSVEMAARELRYAWFHALCRGEAPELEGGRGFDALATAHNANDSAETLMLNILRGCGTKGLRGIPETRHCDGYDIVRPLLDTSREDITAWMQANGHAWREDRTNSDSAYRRNKIRNGVFPVFREINPSFVRTIREDIARFTQADDIADDYFKEAMAHISTGGAISVDGLLGLKHWQYVLWRAVEDCGFSQPTFDKLTTLLERFRTEPRGTVTLGGKTFESPTHILTIKHGTISISRI